MSCNLVLRHSHFGRTYQKADLPFLMDLQSVHLCFCHFRTLRALMQKNAAHIFLKILSIVGNHLFLFPRSGQINAEKLVIFSSYQKKWSNSKLLHKINSAGQTGPELWIEPDDSPREPHLEGNKNEVKFPISTYSSMSWSFFQLCVKHCHGAKSVCLGFQCNVAVCLPLLCLNALSVVDTNRMWLFHLVVPAHNWQCLAGHFKCRACSWYWDLLNYGRH